MPRSLHSTAATADRAYLVAADVDGHVLPVDQSLDELAELARTAGAEVVGRAAQRLDHPHVATYIGKGKLEEVKQARARADANVVIFDDELSPSQQRNLERELDVKVIDRTALILDIFATRAQTAEGRLQVSLAQMEYLLPRLAGQWSHLERMEGAIGTRGPGETQIETDRRLVRNRITKLKRDLEAVRTRRALYRRQRRRTGIPIVALVGYTNAGKSTLMNALSRAGVLSEDRLFATLDPITRRLRLPGGSACLLTDTVGFIQKLPTELVAAFRATLEELEEADLLLHVVDVSYPNAVAHIETVERALADLGLAGKPVILVLNKADLLTGEDGVAVSSFDEARAAAGAAGPQPADVALVSALRGWGLEGLLRRIETEILRGGSREDGRSPARAAGARAPV
jgi:GTP-binding protein HflX